MGQSSKSTLENAKRAKKLLLAYAVKHSAPDPFQVNSNSSTLILNLLTEYCKMNSPDLTSVLRNNSMGCMIQGLRLVYEEYGHLEAWRNDNRDGSAQGNPLTMNPEIAALRRAHRVILAQRGIQTLRANPITPTHICDHAEYYWYGGLHLNGDEPDARDVQLHAIMVLGLNMGMRFDEVQKLSLDHLTILSDGTTLEITESIKNSTETRTYKIRDWPGNSALRYSVLMDPFVALQSWLMIRGTSPGPIFCDLQKTKDGYIINPSISLSASKYKDFLQFRMTNIGIGRLTAKKYTGHSLKRGSVQLYRSLNLRDEQVMEIVQMKGFHAYSNYCSSYNDCSPEDLPRFCSAEDYITHAEKLKHETDWVHDQEMFNAFLADLSE